MFTSSSRLFAAIVLSSASFAAVGAVVTPHYDAFAKLPGATFGGKGIANDPTAITHYNGLTLGMAATPRYSAPALGNNGAGTYFALPGPGLQAGYSTWNFDFYLHDIGGLGKQGMTYSLLYEFNPGSDTNVTQFGTLNLTPYAFGATTVENSLNLGMPFLTASSPGMISAPAGAFDASANGQYSFALIAAEAGVEVARSAINVNVGVVPEPASLALFGLAMLGMTGVLKLGKRRR